MLRILVCIGGRKLGWFVSSEGGRERLRMWGGEDERVGMRGWGSQGGRVVIMVTRL